MVIAKTYKTETAHIVRNAVSERCKFNVHGHSYKWIVHIEGETNTHTGMVLDFKELQPIKEFIDQFDHAMILWSHENPDFIKFFKENTKRWIIMNKNTTAENMAKLVFKFAKEWLAKKTHGLDRVKCVEVWETETGRAIAYDCDGFDNILEKHVED